VAEAAEPDKTKNGVISSPITQAAERIRDSAKWLLVSFAAVGATLVAGLQLADIGNLTNDGPHDRLTWAVVGLALGLGGVVVAIAAASSVVTKSFVTLKGLAAEKADNPTKKGIERDKVLLGGYPTVGALQAAYAYAIEKRRDALRVAYGAPCDEEKQRAAEAADAWAQALGGIQRQVLDQASFNRVRAAYGRARWGILIGAAMSAAGIAAFAWAANPPNEEKVPVVSPMPADVVAVINPSARPAFEKRLGTGCDLTRLRAVALGATGESYQLASVPTEKCTAVVFTLSGRQGRVAPAPTTAAETTPPANGG